MRLIDIVKPLSVLDVGCGEGNYGFLIRRFFPDCSVIDGIEGFKPYITDVQKNIYSTIYEGDIKEILPSLKKYELVLLIDILEHFDEKEAKLLLSLAQEKGKTIIVSVPRDNKDQKDLDTNSLQVHRYQWVKSDFTIPRSQYLCTDVSHICVISDTWYLFHPFMKTVRKYAGLMFNV